MLTLYVTGHIEKEEMKRKEHPEPYPNHPPPLTLRYPYSLYPTYPHPLPPPHLPPSPYSFPFSPGPFLPPLPSIPHPTAPVFSPPRQETLHPPPNSNALVRPPPSSSVKPNYPFFITKQLPTMQEEAAFHLYGVFRRKGGNSYQQKFLAFF